MITLLIKGYTKVFTQLYLSLVLKTFQLNISKGLISLTYPFDVMFFK